MEAAGASEPPADPAVLPPQSGEPVPDAVAGADAGIPAPTTPSPPKTPSRTQTPSAARSQTPADQPAVKLSTSSKPSAGNLAPAGAVQGAAPGSPERKASPTRASQAKLAPKSTHASRTSNLALSKANVGPAEEKKAENVLYEPTYQLAPTHRFRPDAVQQIAAKVLDRNLSKIRYSPEEAGALCIKCANEIQQETKKLPLDRYRIIVDVSIGEFAGQGVRNASRCLWDTATDASATAVFRNGSLFAVAVVFGIYLF